MESPRAGGRYFITGTAAALRRYTSEHERARLTSWLVEQRRLGAECPEVKTKAVDDAKRRPPLSVHERADRLLKCVSLELEDVADTFVHGELEYDGLPCRMAWTESLRLEEVTYLVAYLESSAWIEHAHRGTSVSSIYRITVEGYARLAELDRTATDSSKAFVAMWFDESMDEVWEKAIEPGIEDAGYEAVRIDRKEHLDKIDDEIIAELRRARFIVADFTHGDDGPRGGVYYEAGFAYGLKLPFIFSCRKDSIGKVHFDTRQYPHILWEAGKLDEFRRRLARRISATIGDGPRAG